MQKTITHTVTDAAKFNAPKGYGFNVNKIQAALCIAASAAVSIGLIAWGVTAIL